LKIATKLLHMATRLILTTYRKLPPPYSMVPSLTHYDLLFSHNATRLAYHSATECIVTLQDHPRSMIFMSFESQYVTSY